MTIEHQETGRGKNTDIEIAGLDLNFHAFALDMGVTPPSVRTYANRVRTSDMLSETFFN
ncbi:hypothetical protein LJR098_004475 [Rhizobium sp. LjRoot98]|uniref:hypothetical protein n=1 Tax=unclassified Rhizobium TaxID=2613769 RepID=UPI000AF5641A|nr:MULTISPECIES: hypothetical protein [unclassified Rhizobium]